MIKRLFLFAGYDDNCIIDDTLIFYLQQLSNFGDIVLIMDCEIKDISKLNNIKHLLHVEIKRHNEYDFGSYKRGYMYAYKNNLLNKYDWVYFVNDSVFCLRNLKSLFYKLDVLKSDTVGVFYAEHHQVDGCVVNDHIQSWFIGFKSNIATKFFLFDFVNAIQHETRKEIIVCKYEVGLSTLLKQYGVSVSAIWAGDECVTPAKNPCFLLNHGMPFVKKNSLSKLSLDNIKKYTNKHAFKQIYRYITTRCPGVLHKFHRVYETKLFGYIPLISKKYDSVIKTEKIVLFNIMPIYSKKYF